jgi:hypothetical protein
MHPLQSLCTFYMLYIMYLLLLHNTFSIPSYVDCFIRIYIHKIHISIRLSAMPPIHPTHRRFAPPIHSQLFYFIVKSFYANMSWPVKVNNIPDPGTEPQRGNDSPIPIATLYPMVWGVWCSRGVCRKFGTYDSLSESVLNFSRIGGRRRPGPGIFLLASVLLS